MFDPKRSIEAEEKRRRDQGKASKTKMAVFWVAGHCSVVEAANVSEVLAASIIRAINKPRQVQVSPRLTTSQSVRLVVDPFFGLMTRFCNMSLDIYSLCPRRALTLTRGRVYYLSHLHVIYIFLHYIQRCITLCV
jgi:hypothetical protein